LAYPDFPQPLVQLVRRDQVFLRLVGRMIALVVTGQQFPEEQQAVGQHCRHQNQPQRRDLEEAESLLSRLAQQAVDHQIVARADERQVRPREARQGHRHQQSRASHTVLSCEVKDGRDENGNGGHDVHHAGEQCRRQGTGQQHAAMALSGESLQTDRDPLHGPTADQARRQNQQSHDGDHRRTAESGEGLLSVNLTADNKQGQHQDGNDVRPNPLGG
jgi:hypothetical protein